MAANAAMFMLIAKCVQNNRRRMMHAALSYVLEKRMLVKLSGVVSLLALSENKRNVNRSCR